MTIDIKSVFMDSFLQLFEHVIWLVPIAIIVAMYIFFSRDMIAYNWDLTKREKNKLTEKSLLAIIILTCATLVYLYVKEYFFLLSFTLSFILTYFLYMVGIIDMIANELEDRYGR